MSSNILELQNVQKHYTNSAGNKVPVLSNINISIKSGSFVSIMGPSGSGKSTLLNICGLLESPDQGSVLLNQANLGSAKESTKSVARRKNLGFIYQFHHLLPEFTVLENLLLIQIIRGLNKANAKTQCLEALENLGLIHRKDHYPTELSGGEQQRVAIARAIISKPPLILADEPTGNLDHNNALLIMDIFLKLKKQNVSILMVTHNAELAAKTDSSLHLTDGSLHHI